MLTNGLHRIPMETHPACDDRAERLWTRGGAEGRGLAPQG